MNDFSTHQQRTIKFIERAEREEKTFYGLHNMESFKKVKKLFKYIVAEPINEMTIRVVKYGDDEELALSFIRDNPKYLLIKEGDFII